MLFGSKKKENEQPKTIRLVKEDKKSTNLGIITLQSYAERGKEINSMLGELRKEKQNYIIEADAIRFSNGEGKVKIKQSVRGKDVYILSDISNYSVTYNMYGFTNHYSPDEHFQDIIRTISAIGGKANRITVIMPLLYSSRQHRKTGRESLDCASALRQLESLGVSSVITFDAHDPNIQNATPFGSFDSIFPIYPILKEFVENEKEEITRDNLMIISPDTGAMKRSITYASILGLDVGTFYKRRDYSVIVNGQNPILQHEYTGGPVDGKDVLIIDDMIASGGSVIDIVTELKSRGCKDVYVITTFAFFTEGLDKFNELYEQGIIKRVYSTNASYISTELASAPWFKQVNLNKLIAKIISTLHNNESISHIISSTEKIKDLIKKNDI